MVADHVVPHLVDHRAGFGVEAAMAERQPVLVAVDRLLGEPEPFSHYLPALPSRYPYVVIPVEQPDELRLQIDQGRRAALALVALGQILLHGGDHLVQEDQRVQSGVSHLDASVGHDVGPFPV